MSFFKDIYIGNMLRNALSESEIEMSRICNFLNCSEEEVEEMLNSKSLDTEILLRWSKLLEYDFFRIYSQHLIFHYPTESKGKPNKTTLPSFRKNIYTKEMIDFIIEKITKGEKTKQQIIEEYRIPKTTLYKWLSKFSKDEV